MGYGFQFKKNLAGRSTGIRVRKIITGSQTITIGDAVAPSSGFISLVGAGNKVAGIVTGFYDAQGRVLDSPQADYDGTYTKGGIGVGTYVAASDNTTDHKVEAEIDVDPMSVYSVKPDGTIATTTGSNLYGYYIDVPAASDQTDEDTASATSGQFFIWGVDPDDSTKHLVSIAENKNQGDYDTA